MSRSFHFFGRSELELLSVTVVFQLVALLTLFRVATGVASSNPPTSNTTTSSALSVPTQISQPITIPNSTIQFASPAGSTISGSLILALLFIGANVVVIGFLAILYRKRKMKLFSLLISLFLVFNVTELYFTFLNGLYSWIPIFVSIVALGITIFAAFRGSSIITNAIALVLALELGSSFPVLLQAPLNWIIPAVYAVFDIYAVYYGRLGKLVREVSIGENNETGNIGSPQGSPPPTSSSVSPASSQVTRVNKSSGRLSRWPEFGLLSIRFSEIEIGMADIAFYTMVPAVAALVLLKYSLVGFIVVMAAVDAGILLSFSLFRKREVSPGLPVPILLGLATLFVVWLTIK